MKGQRYVEAVAIDVITTTSTYLCPFIREWACFSEINTLNFKKTTTHNLTLSCLPLSQQGLNKINFGLIFK